MTTLSFEDAPLPSGEAAISKATVDLNAVDYAWVGAGDARTGDAVPRLSLERVLLHELGHVLGLGHTCGMSAEINTHEDHQGRRVSRCPTSRIQARGRVAAMYPSADLFGGSARAIPTLGPDERLALCAVYPR